jgi:hypothetical protein
MAPIHLAGLLVALLHPAQSVPARDILWKEGRLIIREAVAATEGACSAAPECWDDRYTCEACCGSFGLSDVILAEAVEADTLVEASRIASCWGSFDLTPSYCCADRGRRVFAPWWQSMDERRFEGNFLATLVVPNDREVTFAAQKTPALTHRIDLGNNAYTALTSVNLYCQTVRLTPAKALGAAGGRLCGEIASDAVSAFDPRITMDGALKVFVGPTFSSAGLQTFPEMYIPITSSIDPLLVTQLLCRRLGFSGGASFGQLLPPLRLDVPSSSQPFLSQLILQLLLFSCRRFSTSFVVYAQSVHARILTFHRSRWHSQRQSPCTFNANNYLVLPGLCGTVMRVTGRMLWRRQKRLDAQSGAGTSETGCPRRTEAARKRIAWRTTDKQRRGDTEEWAVGLWPAVPYAADVAPSREGKQDHPFEGTVTTPGAIRRAMNGVLEALLASAAAPTSQPSPVAGAGARPRLTVFDVGANVGRFTLSILESFRGWPLGAVVPSAGLDLDVHCFEPSDTAMQTLRRNVLGAEWKHWATSAAARCVEGGTNGGVGEGKRGADGVDACVDDGQASLRVRLQLYPEVNATVRFQQEALGDEVDAQRTLFRFDGERGEESSLFPFLTLEAHDRIRPQHSTPATTVDAYVRARGIERIDLLKIDVEGADPAFGRVRTARVGPDQRGAL